MELNTEDDLHRGVNTPFALRLLRGTSQSGSLKVGSGSDSPTTTLTTQAYLQDVRGPHQDPRPHDWLRDSGIYMT